MADAFKRVFDEMLGPVPTISEPKTLEALVVKYMQKARKELLHSLPSSSSGRVLNHRRPDYRLQQSTKSQGASSMPTSPLSSSVRWLLGATLLINFNNQFSLAFGFI